jgi:hypothetical protein
MRSPGGATFLVVATATFAATGSLGAQAIRGRLLEERTGVPVAEASIALVSDSGAPLGVRARTDSAGAFALRATRPGIVRLRAERIGYRPALSPAVELREGDEISVTLRIVPDTLILQPLVVTANNRQPPGRLGGFYDRMAHSVAGRFITREEIERRAPINVTDLLRTVAGIRVVPGPRGFGAVIRTTEGCAPAVYLDGLRFALMGETLDHIVDPMSLEGIEVYAHALNVPAEFQGFGPRCGAIVLWTRVWG